MQRTYIIDIPTNYDMNKPYRFFYTSHWISSTRRGRPAAELLLPQAAGDRGERAGHLPRASGATGESERHLGYLEEHGPHPVRRPPGLRQSESVHRHDARLRDRIQLRRHDDLLALRESPEGHSRGGRHRAGQLQHLRAHQDPPAHRLDANHRDERHDLSVGQWDQHDPGREVHRHRARDRQRVHGPVDHPDVDVRARISASTSRGA